MTVKSHIVDGSGLGYRAAVNEDNALLVTQSPFPPGGEQRIVPYRAYLRNTAGSNDMRVAGTLAAPQKFFVSSAADADRYITQISFVIADAGATANAFGNIGVLTNGCKLYYTRFDRDITLHDGMKTNFDFMRMALFNPAFGTAADAFRGRDVVGGSEGYMPVLDLTRTLPPYGIKLDAGARQQIILEVRDNITAIDGFDAVAYGFDRLL